jgi:TPR repeat protein
LFLTDQRIIIGSQLKNHIFTLAIYLSYHRPLFFSGYMLLAICLISPPSFADTDPAPTENVLQKLRAEEYSPYSANNFCDDEDEDEDALPDNVIAQLYGNARMAFLFGQYEVAFKAWQPLANDGYAKAQAALAWMYHTGNGVPKDAKTAVKWYLKAAEQGHAIAQNNLAVMYENGLGTRVNEKAAAIWYRESADSGYPYAQYNIGRMYAEGRGLTQSLDEAKYWWRIAARQGVKKAKEDLAILEKQPRSVPVKPKSPAVAHAPYHANPVAKGLAWIEQQKNGYYTIQLAKSKDMNWILKLAASGQLDQPMVQFKTKDAKGEEMHNLIYGTFSSYQQAEKARKVLPEAFRKWSPWLRRFGEIKQILLK